MKLVGSKTEREFLDVLTKSNEMLQDSNSKLRQILASDGHQTNNAYVLHWIPEQLEDIYLVLIDGSYLVNIEINKHDIEASPVIERKEVDHYLTSLSKINRIKLAVAKDLACKKT